MSRRKFTDEERKQRKAKYEADRYEVIKADPDLLRRAAEYLETANPFKDTPK